MKKMKTGFTLAEVLITLGIIGVVAALVMPSVMTNYTYKTVGVKLSKFAAQLEGATRPYVVQNTVFSDNATVANFIDESFIIKNINDFQTQTIDCSVTENKPEVCGTSTSDDFSVTPGFVWTEEPEFKTTSSWVLADEASEANVIINLKDGTSMAAYMLDEDYDEATEIRTEQVGEAIFGIAFAPNVEGLPRAVHKSYKFVVTELGYVYPDRVTDLCMARIYDENFATNSSFFRPGDANNSNACLAQTATLGQGGQGGQS